MSTREILVAISLVVGLGSSVQARVGEAGALDPESELTDVQPTAQPGLSAGELALTLLVEEAWYHFGQRNNAEAARKAAAVLEADPGIIEAHAAYMWAWNLMHGQSVTRRQYRAWFDQDPEVPVRRLLLAIALTSTLDPAPDDCDEIERLLSPLPADPELRYHALLVLESAHGRRCPGDQETDRRALLEMRGQTLDSTGWILRRRLRTERIDDAMADEVRDRVRSRPWDLDLVTGLWSDDAQGPALRRARKETLAAARAAAEDRRVVVVEAARKVLERAGMEDEADALDVRLRELDPSRQERTQAASPSLEVAEVSKMLDPEAGIARLEELRPEVPESGPARAAFELTRVHHLDRLERSDEALEARRLAWLADPEEPSPANDFAYTAALAGVHLEEALQAIDGAIAQAEARVYDRTDWDGSQDHAQVRERERRTLASWRDTRAWVLHRLGRSQEAATEMRRALRLQEGPEMQLHMGLIYTALGLDRPAADHLARGLALGDCSEPALEEEARRVLGELAAGSGWWHPEGLEGYLATLQATLTDVPVQEALSERAASTSFHPLVGQDFPDLEVRVNGKRKRRLSGYEGVRVVDIWATWCSPCVAGLPHMDEVARRYADRDVTVLAVSVDEDYGEVETIFQGAEEPAYELVWAPTAMDEAGVKAIPATFILDPDGRVFDFVQGGGSDDERVDRALDRLLEELAAAE